jgi:hypothetical protein
MSFAFHTAGEAGDLVCRLLPVVAGRVAGFGLPTRWSHG